MSASPYIFDVGGDDFARLVLENSERGPVLVNYWSPRAGPCMVLMPRLVRLATEYGGRFLLAMLNTDEHHRLAREHGVNSLPTVKIFRHGRVADTIHGALSDAEFRRAIDKQVARDSDRVHALAVEAYKRGDTERAAGIMAQAALADPGNARLPLDLAKLLVLQQRYAQAQELLQSLPRELRAEPEIERLLAHVGFVLAAREAPDPEALERELAGRPDDLDLRFRLAARRLMDDDYEAALGQLLEILRRDAAYRDEAARRGMLGIFQVLGDDDERVKRYRGLMLEVLNARSR
ncbi:MAG TPA: tetratricopeptide repeat protein [Acidiferrobacterales bacterium]|jgi:putative thioredoxin